MAVTVSTQISQLYVALFGRAPDATGLAYWVQGNASGDSISTIATQMFAVEASREIYPAGISNADIVANFYVNVMGRTAGTDTEGQAYWTSALNTTLANGGNVGDVLVQIIYSVVNHVDLADGTPENTAALKSQLLFANKTEVADYYVSKDGALTGAMTILADVTDSASTVTAAKTSIDNVVNVGETKALSTGWDNVEGTSGNDTFNAYVVQNVNGEQTNQLATGDIIKAGAGNDTLNAVVQVASALNANPASGIKITSTGLENALFTALDITDYTAAKDGTSNTVTINAKDMLGLNKVGSVQSDANLLIQNLTTLTNSGDYADRRNTDSITVRMDHTGNDAAVDTESDLTVLFDNDYLLSDKSSTDNAYYFLEDRAAAKVDASKPLAHIPNDGIKFTLDGAAKVIAITAEQLATFQETDGTWAGYTALLKGALALAAETDASLIGLDIALSTTVFRTAGLDGTTLPVPAPAIVLSSATSGVVIEATGFNLPSDSVGQYDVFAVYSNEAPTVVVDLVTVNVELYKAGRGAEGGDLTIGGMSTNMANTWDYSGSAIKEGIERFNISVEGDATQFSSLASLQSTNNTLKEVNVVSKTTTGQTSIAGLIIGNHNTAVDRVTMTGALKDVQTFNAAAFQGKLTLNAEITSESITKYIDLKDTAVAAAADNVKFVYTGGAKDDTLNIKIDSAVVSSNSKIVAGREDFTFTANGGAGDDNITVNVANGLNGGAQAWYTNQKLNANVFINGGDGNDTIRTPGAGDVIIDGGAGNDTIYTDNTGKLTTAVATGTAGTAATAYSKAAAAELAAANLAAVNANTTGFVLVAGTSTGASVTTADAAAALNTLNLVTPVDFAVATVPVHSVLVAAITAATSGGGLTFAQNMLLNAAYGNTATAGTVVAATTLVDQAITGFVATADGTAVTAAQFAAGNALLDTYIAAAKVAAAAATSNDTLVASGSAYNTGAVVAAGDLLNTTQKAVVNATLDVNKVGVVASAGSAGSAGSAAVTESAVVTWNGFAAAAGTQVIGGATVTSDGSAIFSNIQVAQVANGGTAINGLTLSAPTAWKITTVAGAPGVAATSVFTSTTANTNVANVNATAPTSTGGAAAPTALTTNGAAAVAAVAAVAAITGVVAGTQTTVNNLATLSTALVAGATDAQVVTALQAAIANGSITTGQAADLKFAAGTGTVDATELLAIQATLTPIQTTAANFNTAAQKLLTTALAADVTAVNTAAAAAAAAAASGNGVVPGAIDSIGSTEAANAAGVAALASTTYVTDTLTPLTTQAANLAALKAAITLGSTDLAVVTATANAAANGAFGTNATIIDDTIAAINLAATATIGEVGDVVTIGQKVTIDKLITVLQLTNQTAVADSTLVAANLAAIATATATASAIAAAASLSGGQSPTEIAPTAVFVLNTANQLNVVAGGYNLVTNDERNLADLKSDANNSYNLFQSKLVVNFMGLEASAIVASTGYKTTDLQINQAIKAAINSDPVLQKLLVATDGPANTLVITSLIDGTMTVADLSITLTAPATGSVSAADIAAAATAYGFVGTATEATLIGATGYLTVAKAAFDTKGDYVDQFAENGAATTNAHTTGANSLSSSDNTVTGGTGNDVIVLGTTVGTDLLTSSNEIVVFATGFGNDTIVNFDATGLGIDKLDFTALNGSGNVALGNVALNKSIVIQAAAATALTETQIAALFTDSATAIGHVYVSYNTHNVGSVYMVTDAVGATTGASNVTAALVGTIDLADTSWSTLTAANFAGYIG